MAILCGVSQSAISRAEYRGVLPESIAAWAVNYGWPESKIRRECAKVARALKRKESVWSDFPLGQFFMDTPLQLQTIRCVPTSEPQSVLTPEYAGEVITRPTVDPVVIGMIAAKARRWRRA